MHIILHTQYYPPEVGAPPTRLHELALGLMAKGHRVTVLTAMPNYPQGRIQQGYGGWFSRENVDGVDVIRAAIYPSQTASMLPRLGSYFSFVVSSLLVGLWQLPRADYLMTESPPLFLGISGWLLSVFKKASWIFNVSDLWPESAVQLGVIGRNSWAARCGRELEAFLYRRAWLVSAQSRTIIENIILRFPSLRTYHFPNGVDTNLFSPGNENIKNEFHFLYAGLHGLAQGLDQVLLAFGKLPQGRQIHLTLIGDGPEKKNLESLARTMILENVTFLPSVSKAEIVSLLQQADALIVPLKTQLTGAVPSKLYEAMSLGKPVILVAESEAAEIVHQAGCGLVVEPGDLDGIVHAMMSLVSNPRLCDSLGRAGRDAAVRNHDRARIVNAFTIFLETEYALQANNDE